MNAEKYEQFKEKVITLNHDELYALFEILVDEINYRKEGVCRSK